MKSSQREEDFENTWAKEYRPPVNWKIWDHSVVCAHQCAWNPDNEFRHFVMETLKGSGYDLQEFGYESLKPKS